MAVPKHIQDEAARNNWGVWCNVRYEDMARCIAARVTRDDSAETSIGLLADDTWVVWYRPRPQFRKGGKTWTRSTPTCGVALCPACGEDLGANDPHAPDCPNQEEGS